MAIKVTNNEVDIETEIMQKLNEFGLSIDFDPDEEDTSKEEKDIKENKDDEEE
jgi:hypothetical protein